MIMLMTILTRTSSIAYLTGGTCVFCTKHFDNVFVRPVLVQINAIAGDQGEPVETFSRDAYNRREAKPELQHGSIDGKLKVKL